MLLSPKLLPVQHEYDTVEGADMRGMIHSSVKWQLTEVK